MTIEPTSPPQKAIREVEAARTSDVADSDLRGRMGFIETARGRRQARRSRRGAARKNSQTATPPSGSPATSPFPPKPLEMLEASAAPRSSTPRRWRASSFSASTVSRTRASPTRCHSAGDCGEHEGPARTSRNHGARSRRPTRSSPKAGLGGRGVYIGTATSARPGSFC